MKIVLLGYMASGKSTVGKILANQLNCDFIDLDEEITRQLGMDIPTIFSKKGEIFFRKKETEVLTVLLKNDKPTVIALGGGTPCYGNNMDIINTTTPHSFYLKLPISVIVSRLAAEKAKRPLVAQITDGDLPEFVGKHLFERTPFYTQSRHTIHAQTKTPMVLAHEIVGFLG